MDRDFCPSWLNWLHWFKWKILGQPQTHYDSWEADLPSVCIPHCPSVTLALRQLLMWTPVTCVKFCVKDFNSGGRWHREHTHTHTHTHGVKSGFHNLKRDFTQGWIRKENKSEILVGNLQQSPISNSLFNLFPILKDVICVNANTFILGVSGNVPNFWW